MNTELEGRRRVWLALSELFLDTEIDLEYIISSLQTSGYSRPDIESIMQNEVAPVLGGHVLSVAGEWMGFDLTPVEQRYLKGQARPTLLGRAALHVIREDWRKVLGQLE